MKITNLKDKKVTVMGLGVLGGGVGTVKFFVKNGAKVLVTDLKSKKDLAESLKKLKSLPIQFVLGKHRSRDFINTDLVVKNPAVKRDSKFLKLAKENGIPIVSDASLFFQYCSIPIIGVTGSKGKSTTVALLAKMLEKNEKKILLVGYNRTSVLDRLSLIKRKSLVLFELSSWRLEGLKDIALSPHLSVVTNIFPDHLNTYRNMNEYAEAKKNIFRFQTLKNFVVLNRDNFYTKNFEKEVKSQRYWFSLKFFPKENGCFLNHEKIFFRKRGKVVKVVNLIKTSLLGFHNKENILAAVTAAKLLRVSNREISYVLSHFQGLADRLELVRSYRKIKFYNDTAATIPDATMAALNSFSQKVILIAGGQDKGLSYQELAKAIIKKVDYLALLPGTATEKLLKYLKPKDILYRQHQSLKSAFLDVSQRAKNSDIILFSPGAASFNLFKNEFDRGKQFKKLVKNLP